MNSKILKGSLCAALACSLLAGCAEEGQTETVDLNAMSFDEIAEHLHIFP